MNVNNIDYDFRVSTLPTIEKEGYISRSVTDEDNRRNEIRITDEGLAAIKESRALFEAVDNGMFRGISEEELRSFTDILERIKENLSQDDNN